MPGASVSSEFTDVFRTALKSVSPFVYPEQKNTFFPDFSNHISVLVNQKDIDDVYDESLASFQKNFDVEKLSVVYDLLGDQYSRDYLVFVLIYRLFDTVKIRLPFYYSREFANFDFYNSLKVNDDSKILNNGKIKLNQFSLSKIGWDIQLWTKVTGIIVDFVNQQYKYRDVVKVSPGDYVVDGGACFGDTALYFACLCGLSGRVFSFELVEENLGVFKDNVVLNPEYQSIIDLTTSPLHAKSGVDLELFFSGAGSSVELFSGEKTVTYKSIALDDFVSQNGINKIDFIKLDIEGSELDALKGSQEIIKKFKPKLAICLYHKTSDFWDIPLYIKSIMPEYKLYLDHHTVMSYETILYAI